MVVHKRFRKDFYYRIRRGWFHLPLLRKRQEDIVLLTRKFLEKYYDMNRQGFIEKAALDLLMRYH